MNTKYLSICSMSNALEKAVSLLQSGGIIAFPTETVYGIGALYRFSTIIDEIYTVKNRSHSKPMAIYLYDLSNIHNFIRDIPDHFWILAKYFLPGPLTIVLDNLGYSIGIRVPEHTLCRSLIQQSGPLYATSANMSGYPDLTNAQDVYSTFKNRISAVLTDEKPLTYQQASTVIKLAKNNEISLLRQGSISLDLIHSKMQHNYNYQTLLKN